MLLNEALEQLRSDSFDDVSFLSFVCETVEKLSSKERRLFIKDLFKSSTATKHKFNPYVLNLLIYLYQFRLDDSFHDSRFKYDKYGFPNKVNSYRCSIMSTYGQFVFSCKTDRYSEARWVISPRSNVYNFGINIVEPSMFFDLNDVVIMDLETSGLNPLTSDVIEIALFDPNSGKEYERLLPLKRRKSIPKDISELTGITNEMVADLPGISSVELDDLINKFDLTNKTIMIWSGTNMFDAHFLANLFIESNNKNFKKLRFLNAIDVIKKHSSCKFVSYQKDCLAKLLNISTEGSHRALNDCKIEAQIYKYLCEREADHD